MNITRQLSVVDILDTDGEVEIEMESEIGPIREWLNRDQALALADHIRGLYNQMPPLTQEFPITPLGKSK